MGPSGANCAKSCQTESNGAKWGQTGLKRTKSVLLGQTWPKGPTGSNKVKWGHMGLIFCMHAYFYEIKKSCLATQALRPKLVELWGFC